MRDVVCVRVMERCAVADDLRKHNNNVLSVFYRWPYMSKGGYRMSLSIIISTLNEAIVMLLVSIYIMPEVSGGVHRREGDIRSICLAIHNRR